MASNSAQDIYPRTRMATVIPDQPSRLACFEDRIRIHSPAEANDEFKRNELAQYMYFHLHGQYDLQAWQSSELRGPYWKFMY